MKRITRTIETHTVYGATVAMVNGKLTTEDLDPVILSNVPYTEDRALREIRRAYGRTGSYVVLNHTTDKETYALPIEKFMELAELIPEKEVETINED